MWTKLVCLTRPSTKLIHHHHLTRRYFLSDAYKCTEAWNARLSQPILQKIKPESFYFDLEQRFQQTGECSAIDIDIFANKLTDNSYIDEVADLLHKLRMTEITTQTLESTGHAVIRTYLDHASIAELVAILNDRLSYGVFLDSYTANLALDKLIRNKDFRGAARIATFMMLQEDFDNEITRSLSLYACLKYLENPGPFVVEETGAGDAAATVDENDDGDVKKVEETKETSKSKKAKKEEVRVRVKFLRNEFFDDHFDLNDPELLVGKTMAMIGKQIKDNGKISNSAQLLGLFCYKKYDEAEKLVDKVGGEFYKDAVQYVAEKLNAEKIENENFVNKIKKLMENTNLSGDKFDKIVCDLANKSIASVEPKDIEEQKKIYTEWMELRQKKLNEELDRIKRAQRLTDIENITKNMESEEQKLWFFENEDKLELQIDSKRVYYPKRWFGKKKPPRVVDEGYIPPEITRNK